MAENRTRISDIMNGFGEPEAYAGATAQDKVEVHVLGFDQITRENFRVKLQAQAAFADGRDAEGLPLGFFLNGILIGKAAFDDFGVADIALTIEWAALQKGKALTVKVKGMEQSVPVQWDVPKSPMQLEAEERERQERIRTEQQRKQAEERARQEEERKQQEQIRIEEQKRQEKIWAEQRQRQAEEQAKQERIRVEEQVRQQKIWDEQRKQEAKERGRQEKIRLQEERNERFLTGLLTLVGKCLFMALAIFFAFVSFMAFVAMLEEKSFFAGTILLISGFITVICFKKVFMSKFKW